MHAVEALDDRLLDLLDPLRGLARVGVDADDRVVVDLRFEPRRPAAIAAQPRGSVAVQLGAHRRRSGRDCGGRSSSMLGSRNEGSAGRRVQRSAQLARQERVHEHVSASAADVHERPQHPLASEPDRLGDAQRRTVAGLDPELDPLDARARRRRRRRAGRAPAGRRRGVAPGPRPSSRPSSARSRGRDCAGRPRRAGAPARRRRSASGALCRCAARCSPSAATGAPPPRRRSRAPWCSGGSRGPGRRRRSPGCRLRSSASG